MAAPELCLVCGHLTTDHAPECRHYRRSWWALLLVPPLAVLLFVMVAVGVVVVWALGALAHGLSRP